MAKKINNDLMTNAFIKDIALMMAVNCVRNTIIEEYHARGSLSQEDMKQFNKQVVNKLYTFLRFLLNGTSEEREALFKVANIYYPRNWDKPVIDKSIQGDIKFILEHPNESICTDK